MTQKSRELGGIDGNRTVSPQIVDQMLGVFDQEIRREEIAREEVYRLASERGMPKAVLDSFIVIEARNLKGEPVTGEGGKVGSRIYEASLVYSGDEGTKKGLEDFFKPWGIDLKFHEPFGLKEQASHLELKAAILRRTEDKYKP